MGKVKTWAVLQQLCVCMCVGIYICVQIYVAVPIHACVCAHMHVGLGICVCVHMFTHIHVCLYVCMFKHGHVCSGLFSTVPVLLLETNHFQYCFLIVLMLFLFSFLVTWKKCWIWV